MPASPSRHVAGPAPARAVCLGGAALPWPRRAPGTRARETRQVARPLPAPRARLHSQRARHRSAGTPLPVSTAPRLTPSSTRHATSENAVSTPNAAQMLAALPAQPAQGLHSPKPRHPNPRIPTPPHSCGLPAGIGRCCANERHKRFSLLLAKRTISYSESEIISNFPFRDRLAFPARCGLGNCLCRSASEEAPGENWLEPAARVSC